MKIASLLSTSCLVFLLTCCDSGGASDADNAENGSSFIAFASDFQGFHSWESFPIEEGVVEGTIHLAGPRTEYLNKRPEIGSKTFPVGTIIVKELEVGAVEERKVFALVKRGGGFNSASAPGWEWFELQNNPDGSVARVVWRGVGPPIGENYGGDPNGCASCHGAATGNDFILSKSIRLSEF
jgi:hypothetical protein